MSHLYEVGKPYHPGRTSWPEAVTYNFRDGEHELLFFLADPTRMELDSIRRGPAEFAVTEVDGLLFLLFQFAPGIPWSDAPYEYWLNAPEHRTVPVAPQEMSENMRALLNVFLVDARTGILLAMRAISLPLNVTRTLHTAIGRQVDRGALPDYDSRLARVMGRQSTADLLRSASARGKGGQ